MLKIVIDQIHKNANLSTIKLIWIPCSGIPGLMKLPRDIYEVVDSVEKCKEAAVKYNVKVKVSLATSWIPIGKAYHDEALRIVSNNRAQQVVGYWWLRCRVSDLTHCTTHEVRGDDIDDTMGIKGLEEYKFIPSMYRLERTGGGMEVDHQAGRQIRQILRTVFFKHELEPRWESATTSTGWFYHIPEPRTPYKGRSRRLPAPSSGEIPTHTIIQKRAEIRQAYMTGKSDMRDLPPTGLDKYQWELLLAKSTQADYKQLELVPLSVAPLSSTNRILTSEVGLYTRPVKLKCDDKKPLSTPTTSATDPRASTSKSTNIVVTKIFDKTRQSRTPAMSRLGPRVRPTSEPTLTRKRSMSTADKEMSAGKEERKGEPSKVRHGQADKAKPTADTPMEVDLTTSPVQEDDKAAANRSIDDEELLEDPDDIRDMLQSPPVDDKIDRKGKEESDPDITDEEDMRADFNDIISEITKRFEEKLVKRREKRQKLARSKKESKE
jgi:hypothetical protein